MSGRFRLADYAYAHRGLWHPNGPVENSADAFLAAARAGLGIECDVRPSRDGVAVIFHDQELGRLTERTDRVEDVHSADLIGLALTGGGTLISLADLLDLWPTHAPLLCEIKIDGHTDPVKFARHVAKQIMAYKRPAAIMSFSPEVIENLPPAIMRGQLITPSFVSGIEAFNRQMQQITPTRHDYIACHTNDATRAKPFVDRAGLPLCVWTVRDRTTSRKMALIADAQIFETFDPVFIKPKAPLIQNTNIKNTPKQGHKRNTF